MEHGSRGDRVYQFLTTAFAIVIPLLLVAIAAEVVAAGWPAFREFGVGFLADSAWNPVAGQFGVLPAIFGTVVSSLIALLLAAPLAVFGAVFLSEFAPEWLRRPLSFLVDLLAAIPSVVYGLWGIYVLVPFLRQHLMPAIAGTPLGQLPFFEGPAYGPSLLAAGLILAIMVLPYISAVTREVLLAVPRSQREAALALGATRWETITGAVLPYARPGIIGGIMLGLGRALGETMAVTMVIGNVAEISPSLFAPAYTLASLIANQFNEATGDLHIAALMAAGAVLFAVTLIINILARWMVRRVAQGPAR